MQAKRAFLISGKARPTSFKQSRLIMKNSSYLRMFANNTRRSYFTVLSMVSMIATSLAITIDGDLSDWSESGGAGPVVTQDPADLPDISGDIREISLEVKGDALELTMKAEGIICPSVDETPEGKNNRYYYHFILDTDNNAATGFSTSEYEGQQTGLAKPLGGEVTVQVGWQDGAPNGLEAYNSVNDGEKYITELDWKKEDNRIVVTVPLAAVGLSIGQTIAFGAYQEGSSDGWLVDWVESQEVTLTGSSSSGEVYTTADPADLPDISGDIREISLEVKGDALELTMKAEGIICPSVDETPEGKNNRYYYHFILDTDNNAATGFSTSEYEGQQTGLAKPLGGEVTVQVGWQDGAPNGLEAYNSVNDGTRLEKGGQPHRGDGTAGGSRTEHRSDHCLWRLPGRFLRWLAGRLGGISGDYPDRISRRQQHSDG
jgi:hypothetical protein